MFANSIDLSLTFKQPIETAPGYSLQFNGYDVYSKKYNFSIAGQDTRGDFSIKESEGIDVIQDKLMIEIVELKDEFLKVKLYYN